MTCGKPSCRLRSMENDLKLIEMNEICFRENYISLKEKSDGFRKVFNHSRGDARERSFLPFPWHKQFSGIQNIYLGQRIVQHWFVEVQVYPKNIRMSFH